MDIDKFQKEIVEKTHRRRAETRDMGAFSSIVMSYEFFYKLANQEGFFEYIRPDHRKGKGFWLLYPDLRIYRTEDMEEDYILLR